MSSVGSSGGKAGDEDSGAWYLGFILQVFPRETTEGMGEASQRRARDSQECDFKGSSGELWSANRTSQFVPN